MRHRLLELGCLSSSLASALGTGVGGALPVLALLFPEDGCDGGIAFRV